MVALPVLAFPLGFVVGVSMIKDAIEDRARAKSDSEENNQKSKFVPLNENMFQTGLAKDIKVGCIVNVKKNQRIPCDMILIGTPTGNCFVETKNLDGETNLKLKKVHKELQGHARSEDDAINYYKEKQINCELPDEHIYSFDGKIIDIAKGKETPLTAENFVLRGCTLQNTDWIYGVCVYTGHETKIMKNGSSARSKKSDVEKRMDKYVVITAVL